MNKTRASLFLGALLACLATSCTDDNTPGATADGGGTTDAPVTHDSSTTDGASPEASPEASTTDGETTDGSAADGSPSVDGSDGGAHDGATAEGSTTDAPSDALLPTDALPSIDAPLDVISGG